MSDRVGLAVVLSTAIVPGKLYAVREPGQALRKAKAIELVRRGKWRVEFVDEDPPLIDYARAAHILCPWKEHKALLRDEERFARLKSVSDRTFPGDDHPLDHAVMWVLDSTGEPGLGAMHGWMGASPDTWERLCARAGLPDLPDEHRVVYTDRTGEVIAPWQTVLAVCKAFADAEPRTVLRHVEEEERRLHLASLDPATSYVLELLERYRPAFALLRSWAGFNVALAEKDEEIDRLRKIISRTIHELRRSGHDDLARKVERLLKGR
jgi:hypothetical protein